jgi:hypothetical protein
MDLPLAQRNSILNRGASAPTGHDDRIVETDIPARLDSLRWSGFHTRVVLALGITWSRGRWLLWSRMNESGLDGSGIGRFADAGRYPSG